MLEVRLLGQFEVKLDGQPVSLPSRPAQALLAYLILNAGTSYRREQLAGLLWPDTSDENARSNLRHALWRIRKAIETKQTYLITDDLKVQFDPDSQYWLDVHAVDHKLSKDASVDELNEALANYRGELLPGFYEEWITLERERLQAMFERKMELLLDRLIIAQRWTDTLEWGEKWIAFGQTPEPAYRALMQAHAAFGNSAKVAATYERCVQALRADLGAELTLDRAEVEQATALYTESLSLNIADKDQRAVAASLAGFAGIAAARGQVVTAVQLYSAVEFFLREISVSLLSADQSAYDRNVAILRAQLDEKTFAKFWAKGATLTLEQAIAFALETRGELKE